MKTHLVQVLLPLADNDGHPLSQTLFQVVAEELVRSFDGLTAYTRAPAKGLWKKKTKPEHVQDDIIIYEVMTEKLDRKWWKDYRGTLEARFRQQQIIIWVQEIEQL
jgi:hypothetical protein